jgi:hypothetical protein
LPLPSAPYTCRASAESDPLVAFAYAVHERTAARSWHGSGRFPSDKLRHLHLHACKRTNGAENTLVVCLSSQYTQLIDRRLVEGMMSCTVMSRTSATYVQYRRAIFLDIILSPTTLPKCIIESCTFCLRCESEGKEASSLHKMQMLARRRLRWGAAGEVRRGDGGELLAWSGGPAVGSGLRRHAGPRRRGQQDPRRLQLLHRVSLRRSGGAAAEHRSAMAACHRIPPPPAIAPQAGPGHCVQQEPSPSLATVRSARRRERPRGVHLLRRRLLLLGPCAGEDEFLALAFAFAVGAVHFVGRHPFAVQDQNNEWVSLSEIALHVMGFGVCMLGAWESCDAMKKTIQGARSRAQVALGPYGLVRARAHTHAMGWMSVL